MADTSVPAGLQLQPLMLYLAVVVVGFTDGALLGRRIHSDSRA